MKRKIMGQKRVIETLLNDKTDGECQHLNKNINNCCNIIIFHLIYFSFVCIHEFSLLFKS